MTTTPGRELLVAVEGGPSGVEQLWVRLKEVDPTKWDDLFWDFVAALARHEIVEDVVIGSGPRRLGRVTGVAEAAGSGPLAGPRPVHHFTAPAYPERLAQGF